MVPDPPIPAGSPSVRIAFDQSEGEPGVAVGPLESGFEPSHSHISRGAAASSIPPALCLNGRRMLSSLARAKPIIPRSGIGLRNSTRDARLHDARPCRVVPCHAVSCRALPCRAVPCRSVTCPTGPRDARHPRRGALRPVSLRRGASAAFLSSHLMSCQLSFATRLTTGTLCSGPAPCVSA